MGGIQAAFFENLALVHVRPAHDQPQHAAIFRRLTDLVQAPFQFRQGQMFLGHSFTSCLLTSLPSDKQGAPVVGTLHCFHC